MCGYLKSWFTLALMAVLIAGCGSEEAPSRARSGPNATALHFVEAIKAVDPAALSKLTASPLSDFYGALQDVRVRYGEVRDWLLKRYGLTSDAKLDAASAQWRLPMKMFGDLKLEGLIEGTRTDTSATYRIYYRKKGLRRCHEDLVVEKRGDRWLVVSYGHDTPPESVIGQIKSQATKLKYARDPGMKAVERVSPPSLTEALELFWQQAPK